MLKMVPVTPSQTFFLQKTGKGLFPCVLVCSTTQRSTFVLFSEELDDGVWRMIYRIWTSSTVNSSVNLQVVVPEETPNIPIEFDLRNGLALLARSPYSVPYCMFHFRVSNIGTNRNFRPVIFWEIFHSEEASTRFIGLCDLIR